MRKLISPKKLDKIAQTGIFNSGNTATPVSLNLFTYNSSTKKYTRVGQIFTTLPYLDFKMRETGDAFYNLDLWGESSARKIFGGEGDAYFGCCGYCKLEGQEGDINMLCTRFAIGQDGAPNGYFYINITGFDMTNSFYLEEDYEILASFEGAYDRYGRALGIKMSGAYDDPDTYADKDPVSFDKEGLEKLTKI